MQDRETNELAKELAAFHQRLAESQVEMPADIAKIIRERLWDLYEGESAPAPAPLPTTEREQEIARKVVGFRLYGGTWEIPDFVELIELLLAARLAPPAPLSAHDAECEAELTSHGYTSCRCDERAASSVPSACRICGYDLLADGEGGWSCPNRLDERFHVVSPLSAQEPETGDCGNLFETDSSGWCRAAPSVPPLSAQTIGTHSLERTSPKGGPFFGRCVYCGVDGLRAGAALQPCASAPSQDVAVLEAIAGSAPLSAQPTEEQLIDERDEAQEWADKLAYAIAHEDVIGEHSNLNNPWANALEALATQRVPILSTDDYYALLRILEVLPIADPFITNLQSKLSDDERRQHGNQASHLSGPEFVREIERVEGLIRARVVAPLSAQEPEKTHTYVYDYAANVQFGPLIWPPSVPPALICATCQSPLVCIACEDVESLQPAGKPGPGQEETTATQKLVEELTWIVSDCSDGARLDVPVGMIRRWIAALSAPESK